MDAGERAPLIGQATTKSDGGVTSSVRTVATFFVSVVLAASVTLNVAQWIDPEKYWLFVPPPLKMPLDAEGKVTEWPRR